MHTSQFQTATHKFQKSYIQKHAYIGSDVHLLMNSVNKLGPTVT